MAEIDRRKLIVGTGAIAVAGQAVAQQSGSTETSNSLSQAFANQSERDSIAHGVITINYILTVQFIGVDALPRSALDIERFLAPMFSFDSDAERQKFVNQLSVADFSRIDPAVTEASGRATQLLQKAGSPEKINDQVVQDFRRMSRIIYARSNDNDHWWCKCYGLKVLC